ncbi:hypothetical protein HGM15179_001367, partial [Zosterops borbonicus]
ELLTAEPVPDPVMGCKCLVASRTIKPRYLNFINFSSKMFEFPVTTNNHNYYHQMWMYEVSQYDHRNQSECDHLFKLHPLIDQLDKKFKQL